MRTFIRQATLGLAAAVIVTVLALGGAGAVGVGQTCGGITPITCNAGLWCEPQAGKCGGADISGKCVRVPKSCTREFRPVCGCDNKTYGNDCSRRMAKVAKARNGKCY